MLETWQLTLAYSLHALFSFHQTKQSKAFRGASAAYGGALALSSLLATLTGLILIVAAGWNLSIWLSLGMLGAGFAMAALVSPLLIERLAPPFAISAAGFIGWPVCSYIVAQHVFQ